MCVCVVYGGDLRGGWGKGEKERKAGKMLYVWGCGCAVCACAL